VYEFFLNQRLATPYMRVLFLVGLIICPLSVLTQDLGKIDSLKTVLQKKEGTEQIAPLIQLAIQYSDKDNGLSLSYIDKAYTIASNSGDSARIVTTGRIKGQLLRRVERIDEAMELFLHLLPTAKRHNYTSDYKIILNSLALTYTLKANYDKALDFHYQSLVLRETEGDKAEISISLNNIGWVYFKLKNYEKAEEYFQRALKYKKEANDTYDLDRLYVNLGISYVHLGKPAEAEKYLKEGLKICDDKCNPEIKMDGQFGLGVANFYMKNDKEAEYHFEKSLGISRLTNNKRYQAENLVYLGRVEMRRTNFSKAKEYLDSAEVKAGDAGYNQLLMDVYKEFYKFYSLQNDFQRASAYQDRYIVLKDSLIGEELVKNISQIQTNFEERVNIATIADKEEALTRQRNLNIAIGIIAILAGLLVFVLYRSNVITRKVNTALSDAKGIIETQNHRLQNINRELDAKVKEKTADLVKANEDLDKANKSLVRVNDELDNFIYKTSHDIRGPLASLKGICSVALMDVKDALALDYLNKLDVSSGRLNVILTRLLIVNQINHAVVGKEQIDFNNIVDDVLLLERKKGLPERLEIRRDIEKNISFFSDKDLVRIILENLIDNSIKFYNDSGRIQPFVQIKITLQDDREVIVSVVDNGIGIAEAKPDKIFQMFSRASERSGTGGIGLYLSKLATEKLGGQINLRSTPEGYTEFYVSFPLKMQLV
jgi:signal transduction histidine kinase/Tfp pilus assembly protein PilF